MNLLHLFKSEITSLNKTNNVKVDYMKVNSMQDIVNDLTKDVLLIKKVLTAADCEWISKSKCVCDIYTETPKNIEAFDSIKKIGRKISITMLKSIDLDYLYSDNDLFVFSDDISDSSIPNMIKITPVRREEIFSLLPIRINESIPENYIYPTTCELNNSISQITHNNVNEATSDSSIDTSESKRIPVCTFEMQQEKQLLQEKIVTLFNEKYYIIKAKTQNTSFERKTISLTKIYNKLNISKGKLRGTWILFDENTQGKIDIGIVGRAIDKLNKKYTLQIKSFHKIIQKENYHNYQESSEKISDDYINYLHGEKIEKIGDENIQQRFMINDIIEENKKALYDYFCTIWHTASQDNIMRLIDNAIYDAFWGNTSRVVVHTDVNALTAEQLNNFLYVSNLLEACCKNEDFFEKEFKRYLERYYQLYVKTNS